MTTTLIEKLLRLSEVDPLRDLPRSIFEIDLSLNLCFGMDTRLIFAILTWLALFAWAVYPIFQGAEVQSQDWLRRLLGFLVLLGVALPVWRWRSLTYNGEINVDEGTAIAIALKYLHDPVPWRSVDGITCGPISTWVTLWAPLLGLKLSYLTLRITSLILILFCGIGTVFSMREIVGARLSFLLTLPPVALLLSSLNLDFLYFAMEYLPMAMGVWTVYLILRQAKCVTPTKGFWVGVITGAMPFTKLQAAISGVFLFAVCTGLTVYASWNDRRRLKQNLAWLCAGGMLVPSLILIPVATAGAWPEFLNFYLLCGTTYKNTTSQIPPLLFLLKGSADFGVYFVLTLLTGFLGALFVRTSKCKAAFTEWVVGAALFVVYLLLMLYSVFRSGFCFPHYLLLLIFPLCFLMAWGVRGFRELGPPSIKYERTRRIILCFISLVLTAQSIGAAVIYSSSSHFLREWGEETNPIVPIILKYAKPDDSMAIWGWYNKLHAFSGIRPATRFIGTSYVTDPSENYNRHRELFLSDLMTEKPRFFVDAVDEFRWPTWPPGAQARHDMIPDLSQWVRREYNLVADVQTAPQKLPVRIYVRKDPSERLSRDK